MAANSFIEGRLVAQTLGGVNRGKPDARIRLNNPSGLGRMWEMNIIAISLWVLLFVLSLALAATGANNRKDHGK